MTEASVEVPLVVTEENPVSVMLEKPAAETAPVAKSAVVTPEEGIESLKEQVERAKRDSAQRLAEKDRQIAEAFKRASEAEREVSSVKKDQVGTIIDSLAKDKEAARRDFKIAMETGDFDKAGEAQDRLSLANARLVEAERGKLALENEANASTSGRSLAQPVAQDHVEVVARSMASPKAADWVRQHPEQVTGGGLSPRAIAAHYEAIADGHTPDSDGYFSFLNTKFDASQRSVQPRQGQERETPKAPISAPIGRDITQAPGAQRPGSITLQPNEVRAALDTLSPLYPNESRDQLLRRYAENKRDLIAEGKIARA